MKAGKILLTVMLLSGCSVLTDASASESMDSNTVYSTVIENDGSVLKIEKDSMDSFSFMTVNSDVLVFRDGMPSDVSEILPYDRIMCTYTNGTLSVIEILSESSQHH